LNDSLQTNSSLLTNIINNVLNVSNTGQAVLNIQGTSAKVLYTETDSDDWSMLLSFGDFYFKQETGISKKFNVRGSDNIDKLSVDLATNITTINNSLRVANLTAGSCDVKADTTGNIYCGTDATGGGGGSAEGGWINTTINTSTGLTVFMNDSFNYLSPSRDMNTLFCDFTSATYAVGACSPDFYGTVAGTGGISAIDTAPLGTRGVFSISRGTAAASGYTWSTHISAIRISVGEEFTTLMNFT
jgi:hypothetical protein